MTQGASAGKISYHDKLIWLLGYPLMAISFLFFANDTPFLIQIHSPTFLSDLLFAITVTFSVGLYIRWLTLRMDNKLPWDVGFSTRLFRQFLFGIVLPLLGSMLLEVAYLDVINIPLASSSILNLELPLAFLFLTIINLFYLVSYLFYHTKKEVITPVAPLILEPAHKQLAFITVQKGFTERRVDIKNCALIMSANKVLWLHTYQGEQYRLQGTLEEWQDKFKELDFYRINRQCLAAKDAIKSVEQTETRKLKVNFVIPFDDAFVSKVNVTSFKLWWKKEGPL